MPSSSSEDEDLSKFREAADSSLYVDSLYNKKQGDSKTEEPIAVNPPSLRCIDGEEDDKINNALRVTPEFQKHVAKHLTKLLDRQLQMNENAAETNELHDEKRSILKAKRKENLSSAATTNKAGVRLLGASAVFLSNMNIVPALPHRGRKRKIKPARYQNGSEPSSDDSDSDDLAQKLSAAAVSPDWVLSGAATKGWARKEGRVERCIVNQSGVIVPVKDDLFPGCETHNEICSSNPNSKEVFNFKEKEKSKKSKKKKSSHVESELAASFRSIVSIGSDSQGDTSNKSESKTKKKKLKKKKRVKKDQYSEDATTETTEVEDAVEIRKKKVKKSRKKPKRQRIEEKQIEEIKLFQDCVPGLFDKNEDDAKMKREEKKKRKKSAKKRRREEQSLEKKKTKKLAQVCKKKMKKKVLHLSKDLAKLMMNSNDLDK